MNKVDDFRAHFLALDRIILLLSGLALLQRDIAMSLTSTLSHLCEMNSITR